MDDGGAVGHVRALEAITVTDWLFYAALALAVMGWATAFGLYLQARDALKLAKVWREIAVDLLGLLSRERHLSEFAVRAMEEPIDDGVIPYHELREKLRVVDEQLNPPEPVDWAKFDREMGLDA